MSSEASQPNPTKQTFVLPDSRTLCWAEYGTPTGFPIVLLHGSPGSRLEGADLSNAASNLNIRLVCPDRPGIGGSSPQPGRALLDYPADIAALVKHLGVNRYAILGGSGGGPYALACALKLPPEEVSAVGVAAGIGPWHEMGSQGMSLSRRIAFSLAAWAPARLVRWLHDVYFVRSAQDADPAVLRNEVQKLVDKMPEVDRAVFRDNEGFLENMTEALRASYAQGADGNVEDGRVTTEPWGFEIEAIQYEGVRLWYGDKDENTPARMGHFMARRLPNSVLKVYEGETHFTIWTKHLEEILDDLLKAAE